MIYSKSKYVEPDKIKLRKAVSKYQGRCEQGSVVLVKIKKKVLFFFFVFCFFFFFFFLGGGGSGRGDVRGGGVTGWM